MSLAEERFQYRMKILDQLEENGKQHKTGEISYDFYLKRFKVLSAQYQRSLKESIKAGEVTKEEGW